MGREEQVRLAEKRRRVALGDAWALLFADLSATGQRPQGAVTADQLRLMLAADAPPPVRRPEPDPARPYTPRWTPNYEMR